MAMNLSLVCLLVTFSTLLFSIDAVEESTSPIFDVVETEHYERLPSSMIDTLKRDGRMDQLKPIRQEQQYNVSGVLTFRGPIQTMTCNETIKSMVTQICFDDESKMIINKKRQIESIQDLIAPLIKRNYAQFTNGRMVKDDSLNPISFFDQKMVIRNLINRCCVKYKTVGFLFECSHDKIKEEIIDACKPGFHRSRQILNA